LSPRAAAASTDSSLTPLSLSTPTANAAEVKHSPSGLLKGGQCFLRISKKNRFSSVAKPAAVWVSASPDLSSIKIQRSLQKIRGFPPALSVQIQMASALSAQLQHQLGIDILFLSFICFSRPRFISYAVLCCC
jgi:hypothetical protein